MIGQIAAYRLPNAITGGDGRRVPTHHRAAGVVSGFGLDAEGERNGGNCPKGEAVQDDHPDEARRMGEEREAGGAQAQQREAAAKEQSHPRARVKEPGRYAGQELESRKQG
jgi:hypothetical protein